MDVQKYAEKSVLCWLATAGSDLTPNVSPKELFAFIDEELMVIANISSPESEKNILQNPKVCVSFIEVFEQRGFKVKGTAEVVYPNDAQWQTYLTALEMIVEEPYPISNIFAVRVEALSKILAPSYTLFPHISVESKIKKALENYKVNSDKQG
ncbi:pyridoxamine 5'-phosphate oxidase family protein [Vibrio sp. SS-MA-C1-2]|uniref:pyridoxamine 5'-phosphate oxidase family protein n=1 Tax=Vibrio sp. SS-MA-C1-2 TaxID=2908646 RepID=UPI001F24D26C|nr:pyridoxamine 5'-phosphate oxidase family protein [Vibrio sp. SS-MA-C1-2]UJF16901.1 pyridoxamine 5'-phosphate oxidase family protein [Vibrio sp. SS-MA-C1-2]